MRPGFASITVFLLPFARWGTNHSIDNGETFTATRPRFCPGFRRSSSSFQLIAIKRHRWKIKEKPLNANDECFRVFLWFSTAFLHCIKTHFECRRVGWPTESTRQMKLICGWCSSKRRLGSSIYSSGGKGVKFFGGRYLNCIFWYWADNSWRYRDAKYAARQKNRRQRQNKINIHIWVGRDRKRIQCSWGRERNIQTFSHPVRGCQQGAKTISCI